MTRRILAALIAAALVLACDDTSTVDPDGLPTIVVQSAPASLLIGDTARPTAVVMSGSGEVLDTAQVRWDSDNTGIVRIVGFVAAVAAGEGSTDLVARWRDAAPVRHRIVVTRYSEPQRHAGIYSLGFEVSAFRPCGSTERYWVHSAVSAVTDFMRDKPEYNPPGGFITPRGQVYVEWIARHSGVGAYGHLGAHRREMVVDSVSLVQAEPPGQF